MFTIIFYALDASALISEEDLMSFRFQNRRTLLIVGSWMLALANIWQWFGHRIMHFSDGVVDGAFGLFMGVGIAVLLLSIRAHLHKCEP
jgi:hypothetical protein